MTLIKSLPKATPPITSSPPQTAPADRGFSSTKASLDDFMAAGLGRLEPFVTHDVRRTVRTRMSEMHIDDKIAEMVIGHGKRGIARVYDQARHLPAMRAALDMWAARLAGIVGDGAEVLPFKRKGRPAWNEPNILSARAAARMLLQGAKQRGAFSPRSGRLAFRHKTLKAFECSAFSPEEAAEALELVKNGDHDARIALHTALAQFIAMNEPIPEVLRPYLLELLPMWAEPFQASEV